MATSSPPAFPRHGLAVGGIARKPQSAWPLHLMAGAAALMLVLLAAVAVLALAGLRPIRSEHGLALAVVAINVSMLGVCYVDTRLNGPVVRLAAGAVGVAAGSFRLTIPWSSVVRLWIVGSGSAFPVLCIAIDQPSRFAPGGLGWRLKAYASRRLFGTPLAVPLTSTGLSESGVRAVVRAYLDGSGGARARGPEPVGRARNGVDRRFRGLLIAALAVPAGIVVGGVWGSLVAQTRAEPGWWSVQLVVLGVAATAVAAVSVATLYTALAPPGATRLLPREPVLRVGPDGVEHLTSSRVRRVPWPAVRAVYPARDQAGGRFLCVATADPSALLPRGVNRSIRARRNQRRFGAPVAVPLAGSGVAEADLLDAVQYFSGLPVTAEPAQAGQG